MAPTAKGKQGRFRKSADKAGTSEKSTPSAGNSSQTPGKPTPGKPIPGKQISGKPTPGKSTPGKPGNALPSLQQQPIVKDSPKKKGRGGKDSFLSPVSPITFNYSFSPLAHNTPQKPSSHTFYELVATQPALDYSSFATIHKLLLQDPSSISGLLKAETTREPFILGFQEQASSIVAFYERLRPYFTKNPSQNITLAKPLLEGLLLPLFINKYQDIFIHDEMRQLITVSLQSYCDCGTFSSPGLVAQLVVKLTMFPDTRLLERFIAHPESGSFFLTLVEDPKFGGSLFEHGHATLQTWIERLIQLSDCGFDHGIAEPVRKWEAIGTLKSTYPQTTVLTPSSEGFQVQKRVGTGNLRKLSGDERGSGGFKASCEDIEKLVVPPRIQAVFKEFGVNTPRTLAAARNAVHNLEMKEAFGIFEAIARSFPCSNCCEAPLKDGYQTMYQIPADDCGELNLALEESCTDGTQLYRGELKHLGLWRIVLSRQAMKDFSDARKSGQFAAVESKLRELATGNWGKRKALTKKHINPDWRIPIKKAVYDDNGRIIWHVYLSFDEMGNSATQVILVWRIGDHKVVEQSETVILRHQKTFGKEFIEACKLRIEDRNTGGFLPKTFGTELLEQENITATLSREESLDLHNAVITGKFYTLTQNVLDGILASGTSAEFPFDVAHDEVEIIRQTSSASFILGRSGTGKTTCLAFKLLSNYIGSRAASEGILSADRRPIRQVFITRSEILAGKLNGYIRRLVNCQLGRFDSDDMDSIGLEILKEKDEETEDCHLWSLKEEDFPLVCTFDKLLSMVETSLKKSGRNHWKASEPSGTGTEMHRRRGSVAAVPTRPPREVDAQTFIQDYWSKISASIKLNVPVDLVFSEIMGIIKGSTSALPGRNLRALTREEYLNRSCRVAPLFTSETERRQVYTIYEHYERLKAEYHDWDGVDRTRDVFIQLQENPAVLTKLKEVVEEIYVDEIQDQRLLEIEFLLTLVPYPRGVHLAGDSAQCISRDSTFRFSDIKALFYDVFHRTATAMKDSTLAKPKEFKLAHNYRSHQGIIALGALLIDNLWKGFPDMIDKLRPEIGKYSGPKPTFFAGFKAEDVLMSQSFGLVDLYDQLADFGADQVILVRDEDVQKEIHSRIGSEVLILTVLQSKGMEFEDVVLLNFFSSSGHGPHYRALDKLIDSQYGEFDPKKHSVLCAELKALYVAVTRCRANLRIMEENHSIAELIVNCWTEKVPQPLIETVRPGDVDAPTRIKALRSGSSGNPALWLKNGQHLMEKRLYKQALFCFQKTQHKQLQIHAMAHLRRQEAEALTYEKTGREQLRELYRESAELFLEAAHPLEASKSLEAAGLFEEAADMWAARGRPGKAAPLYERAGEHSKASKTYHRAAMYTEATKSLRTGELYEDLVQYLETVKNDLDPVQYQRSSKLCNLLAHQGKLGPSYRSRTLELLGSDLKIEMFYRQRGYTNDLLEFFRSRGRLRDAFQYLTSIGKVEQAVLLAPFEEMKASISIRELNRMQQLLLISDLRKTQGSCRPVYADSTHQHARPGMDELWDALYRDLMSKALITTANAGQQVDNNIDGFAETRRYLDIIILERMDDTVPRAPDIMRLPIQSVNYGLDLLRDLHFAKQEVPDVLRRFIGAYRQSNRSSLLLLSNSLFNKEGKIYRQISQDRLLKFSKEWFANLVMKAAFSFLDSALVMWNSMRSGSHCIIFSATNQCGQIRCPYTHYIITSKAYYKLCKIIHQSAFITSKLRFFYATLREFIEDGLLKEFRRKQRRWLEATFTELTYISALQQCPKAIQDASVSHTHEEKHKIYRWLRDDLEKLLVEIHVKEEWDKRSTFSELLELTQRSWQLGSHTAYIVRQRIWKQHKNMRQWNLDPSRRAGLELFLNRPTTNRGWKGKNYDPLSFMSYFNDITRLHPAQLTAFHAVLCEYERIATYLLLLDGGGSAFFILKSWIAIHIPEVSIAYCNYLHQQATLQQRNQGGWMSRFELWNGPPKATQEIRACLFGLVQSLLDLALNLFCVPGNRVLFKFGGERGAPLPADLLLRRCLDIASICLINIQAGHYEVQGFDSRPLMVKLRQALPFLGNGLGIYLPPYLTNESFLRIIHESCRVYIDKESVTFVQAVPDVPRFARHLVVIQECSIPVVSFATIDPMSRYDISQLSLNTQDQSEQPFSSEQLKAAGVICRIWREYWPLYKKAKEWRSTPLGRSTTAINELCESYRPELTPCFAEPCLDWGEEGWIFQPEPRPGIVEDLYRVFWGQGPKTHEAITAAETQGFETAERYQQFFISLYGTTYTDDDLERVEVFFEEVEEYTGKIAAMKTTFSLEGMRKLFSEYETHGAFATGNLKEHMVAMQREAAGITHVLIRLGNNRYVNSVEL